MLPRNVVRGLGLVVLVIFFGLAVANAQNGGMSTDTLIQQQIERALGQGRLPETGGELGSGKSDVIQPLQRQEEAFKEPSAVENAFAARSGLDLKQFGYEEFGVASSVMVRQSGAVQESYVLGAGDEIVVDLRGQENRSYRVRVDRDGRVSLPGLVPVSASGRRFGEVRQEIEARVADSFIATQAFISIGAIRQVNVFVTGEVNAPGAVTLNALNSPIDALLLAGGVRKSGTLRDIRIIRGQEVLRLDLYGVLAGVDVPLVDSVADGDRIVVRAIGATVAVTGAVNRPGIYELAPGQESITLSRQIEFAGGYLNPGAHRISALRVRADGTEEFVGLGGGNTAIRRGDIVFVERAADLAKGRVVLEGQVRLPGMYDLGRVSTLKALIGRGEVYQEQSYMLFGAISRRDPETFFRTVVPFAPLQVLKGRFDLPLQSDDVVRIFSVEEVRELSALLAEEQSRRESETLRRLSGQATSEELAGDAASTDARGAPPEGTAAGAEQRRALGQSSTASIAYSESDAITESTRARLEALSRRSGTPQSESSASDEFQMEPLYRLNAEGRLEPVDATELIDKAQKRQEKRRERAERARPELFFDMTNPAIRNLIGNYSVEILGAVHIPGEYLVMPGTSLESLAAAAGGISINADLTAIEITSTTINLINGTSETSRANYTVAPTQLASVLVSPRDVVRFREVYSDRDDGQVYLSGQVRYPGQFDILRGEKLSSVLARAGGLTDVAYPYGAIFTRVSAARAEEAGYRRAADELERQFAVLVAEQNVSQQGIVFVRETIEQLQEAQGLGRISVVSDPVVLAGDPTKDIILEPGDRLFVPRRPNSVSVTGEVLSAGSYQFETGKSANFYVRLAGGFGPVADRRRAFILLPDGTARRIEGSLTRLASAPIVPGSTIIVPRDLRPFRFRQFALDLSQITSQLAVSAASIAVVTRDN